MESNTVKITECCIDSKGGTSIQLEVPKLTKNMVIKITCEGELLGTCSLDSVIEDSKITEIFNMYNSLPNKDIPKKRSLSPKDRSVIEKGIKHLKSVFKTMKSDGCLPDGVLNELDLAKLSVSTYSNIMKAHNRPTKQFFWGYPWNVVDFFRVGNNPRFVRFIPGGDMFTSFEKYKNESGYMDHCVLDESSELTEEDGLADFLVEQK